LTLRQGDVRVEALAACEERRPAGFDKPALLHAHMLLRAAPTKDAATRLVGATCRVCPLADCAARREPSILAAGV